MVPWSSDGSEPHGCSPGASVPGEVARHQLGVSRLASSVAPVLADPHREQFDDGPVQFGQVLPICSRAYAAPIRTSSFSGSLSPSCSIDLPNRSVTCPRPWSSRTARFWATASRDELAKSSGKLQDELALAPRCIARNHQAHCRSDRGGDQRVLCDRRKPPTDQ